MAPRFLVLARHRQQPTQERGHGNLLSDAEREGGKTQRVNLPCSRFATRFLLAVRPWGSYGPDGVPAAPGKAVTTLNSQCTRPVTLASCAFRSLVFVAPPPRAAPGVPEGTHCLLFRVQAGASKGQMSIASAGRRRGWLRPDPLTRKLYCSLLVSSTSCSLFRAAAWGRSAEAA